MDKTKRTAIHFIVLFSLYGYWVTFFGSDDEGSDEEDNDSEGGDQEVSLDHVIG